MGVFRVAAFAAMTSLAFIPSIAQANSACWYPNEARAAQVRGLQTMLMVGTLQCRHRYGSSERLYGDFIRSQRGFLDANGRVLKGHFMRENGVLDAQSAYDRFGTTLANQYSEQLDNREFCETVHNFARIAARASREELIELAEAVAEAPQSGVCRPSDYTFDRPHLDDGAEDYRRRREPPPPPRIAISNASEPAAVEARAAAVQQALNAPAPEAAPEPVAVAEAAPAPQPVELVQASAPEPEAAPAAVPVEAKVELIQQVKAEPAVMAAAQPNRDQALQAAIAALQSAVVALQAASTTEGEPGPVNAVEVPGGPTSK